MQRVRYFTRRLLTIAAAMAALSACIMPAVAFSLGYGVYAARLETKARVKAEQIEHLILAAPALWTFQEVRLASLLTQAPGALDEERAEILALDGTRVATLGDTPGWPAIRREATLFDAGRPVGRLVLAHSAEPLLKETAKAGLFGLALGLGFFAVLWMMPVRALRAAALALREEKDRLGTTLRSIADAVVTTDAAGLVTSLNPAGERMLGLSRAQAAGQPIGRVLVLEDEESGAVLDVGALLSAADGQHQARLVPCAGAPIGVQVAVAAIRAGTGAPLGHVLTLHDVDTIRQLSKELEWQASHDSLTELANRRQFEHALAQALKGVQERGEHHVVLFMDLDQFKVVNDTCGHVAGDQLLRQITALLRARTRRADCLARIGGDEFALLLTHCPHDKAEDIAQTLLQAVGEERFAWDDKVFSIGMSIGLVELTAAFEDGSAVLRAADSACYAAKAKGKGQVQVYSADDAALKVSANLMAWTARITRALDDGRFVLHYQPYRPLGADLDGWQRGEILLRMIDERNELVLPGAFIPAAERFDLMVRLDQWVIAEAFAQYSRLPPSCRQAWSINLSGQSMSHDGLLEHVMRQAQANGVPPEGICFEVTETAAINNLAQARAQIAALRQKGFRFALDDFGSGLSSFAYLKQLPIDYLKIDGTFIRGIVGDPLDRAMVSAAHEIAAVLGIRTVAEYVEDESILMELRTLGIDYAQGYAVARPIPLIAHVNAQLNAQLNDPPTPSMPAFCEEP